MTLQFRYFSVSRLIKSFNIINTFQPDGQCYCQFRCDNYRWMQARMVKKKAGTNLSVAGASSNKSSSKNQIASPNTSKSSLQQNETSDHASVSINKDGSLSIQIQVKPGSKQDAITVGDDHIGVHISAPPVDGEANLAIIKYFAQILKVKKGDVELKGGKSREKVVTVQSDGLTVKQVLERLIQEQNGQ